MTAGLLLFPGVVIGTFALLLATTWLERFVGLWRSDRWPLLTDIELVPVVATVDLMPPSRPWPSQDGIPHVHRLGSDLDRSRRRPVQGAQRTQDVSKRDVPSERDRPWRTHHASPTPKEEGSPMGIVLSMLIIAVGAIMRFAVTVEGNGFNVDTAGMVLMVVGVVGAVLSIAFWASWGGFVRPGQRTAVAGTTETVVRERQVL